MKGAALFVALWVGALQSACTKANGDPIEVRLQPEDRPAGAVRRGWVELDGSRCELEIRDGNGDGVWNTVGTDGLEVRSCRGRGAASVRRGLLRTAAGSYYQLEWEVPRDAAPGATFAVRVATAFPARRDIQLAFEVTVPGAPASAPTTPSDARPR